MYLVVGAGVAVIAGGPTWTSVGLASAQLVAGLLTGLLMGRFMVRFEGRAPSTPLITVIGVVPAELLRAGLVAWSGVGVAEAAWAGLLASIPVLLFGSLALRRVRPAREGRSGEDPGPAIGPGHLVIGLGRTAGDVAAWMLVAVSPWLVLLTFAAHGAAAAVVEPTSRRVRGIQAISGYVLAALLLALLLI
jgi:hypothetical protein